MLLPHNTSLELIVFKFQLKINYAIIDDNISLNFPNVLQKLFSNEFSCTARETDIIFAAKINKIQCIMRVAYFSMTPILHIMYITLVLNVKMNEDMNV